MTAQRIIQHIFKEPGLEKVTQWELEKLVSDYPFFTASRVLLAKRAFQRSTDLQHEAVIKALLYTNTPHYFYQFIQSTSDVPATSYTLTGGHAEEAGENVLPAFVSETTEASPVAALHEEVETPAFTSEAVAEETSAAIHANADAFSAHEESAGVNTGAESFEANATHGSEANAIQAENEITTEIPEATHPAEPALVAASEVGAGAFNTIAPEITIALSENITPANAVTEEVPEAPMRTVTGSKPVRSFHEEMEAFRRSLGMDAPAEPEVPKPLEAVEETPAPVEATAPVEQDTRSDFHKRMEAFRKSLAAAKDENSDADNTERPVDAHTPFATVTEHNEPVAAHPENADTAFETEANDVAATAATDAPVTGGTEDHEALTPIAAAEEAALLNGFNVHSFQEELEAIKNRLKTNTPASETTATDDFQAEVEHNTPTAIDSILEAGASAAANEISIANNFHEAIADNTAASLDDTLETGAIAAAHALQSETTHTANADATTPQETALHETLEAGAIAAATDLEAGAALPAFTEETSDTTHTDHYNTDIHDIQLVSDAINDQLPVPSALPPAATDEPYNAPRITTWLPAQHRTYTPADEDAIEKKHAAVVLPAAKLNADALTAKAGDVTPVAGTPSEATAAENISAISAEANESATHTAEGIHAATDDIHSEANESATHTAEGIHAATDDIHSEANEPATHTAEGIHAATGDIHAEATQPLENIHAEANLPATDATEDIPADAAHTAATQTHEALAAHYENASEQDAYEDGPIKIYPLEMPDDSQTALTFQPLYTDDYFAYKKLKEPQAAEALNEKGASEMKSFTNWLRVMKDSFAEKSNKDWYHEQLHRLYEEDEETGISERVEKMALQSITLNDDIVSETLAEIWAKQRQHQKAIQIYKKLSLLNPGKSAYFAQKINELQSDINK